MDYVKPKKNLRLKSRIVLMYGTAEDFSLATGISRTKISQAISNRELLCTATKARYANRLQCKIMDIF